MVYHIKNVLLICSKTSKRNSKSQPNLLRFLIYLLDLNFSEGFCKKSQLDVERSLDDNIIMLKTT